MPDSRECLLKSVETQPLVRKVTASLDLGEVVEVKDIPVTGKLTGDILSGIAHNLPKDSVTVFGCDNCLRGVKYLGQDVSITRPVGCIFNSDFPDFANTIVKDGNGVPQNNEETTK